jgi:hypothetical protein
MDGVSQDRYFATPQEVCEAVAEYTSENLFEMFGYGCEFHAVVCDLFQLSDTNLRGTDKGVVNLLQDVCLQIDETFLFGADVSVEVLDNDRCVAFAIDDNDNEWCNDCEDERDDWALAVLGEISDRQQTPSWQQMDCKSAIVQAIATYVGADCTAVVTTYVCQGAAQEWTSERLKYDDTVAPNRRAKQLKLLLSFPELPRFDTKLASEQDKQQMLALSDDWE